jgi:hypothetical protein
VGGTNTFEDSKRLKERLNIAVETIGRSFALLEHKTINPSDRKSLCVDDVQQLLAFGCENQFADFCEWLPKDAEASFLSIFLSTKTRYGTLHGLSKLLAHKSLHFLVKENPAPGPSTIPHDPGPVCVDQNQSEVATRSTVQRPSQRKGRVLSVLYTTDGSVKQLTVPFHFFLCYSHFQHLHRGLRYTTPNAHAQHQ